jgi:hypothetical protein
MELLFVKQLATFGIFFLLLPAQFSGNANIHTRHTPTLLDKKMSRVRDVNDN